MEFEAKKTVILLSAAPTRFSAITDALSDIGLEVETVPTLPQSGVAPHVLLIDYDTHAKDLPSIMAHNQYRTVPVVAIMPQHDTEAIEEVVLAGVSDYGVRSDSPEVFVLKVKAILDNPSFTSVASASSAIDISDTNCRTDLFVEPIRVFVVEDDPLLRNLLANLFEKYNFPCAFSHDGSAIVEKLRQFKPDVIVLDLMLPGKSGFDVLAEAQTDPNLHAVPVVVFSNRDNPEDRARARSMGVKHFYVKAITELTELIDALVEIKRDANH